MKHKKIIGTVMLAAALFTFNCKKDEKDDSTQNFLLAYLVDQASGNCATIQKSTTGTTYTATGSKVPKGGCNATTLLTTLYTTSPAAAKTAVDTFFDAGKAVYDAQSACSAFSTALTAAKSATTEATITTTQNGLTSGNLGCTSAGSYPYRVSSSKWSSVQICKDEASITAVKALISYQNITSAATDMATSLSTRQTLLTASKSTNGFTDTQILTLEPHGVTELGVFSGINYITYLLSVGTVACAKQIVESDASLKSFLASTSGLSTSTGVTQADVTAVTIVKTSPLTPVSCGYGSGFTAGTTTGACPSTYPSF